MGYSVVNDILTLRLNVNDNSQKHTSSSFIADGTDLLSKCHFIDARFKESEKSSIKSPKDGLL